MSDTAETKLNTIALGVLLSERKLEWLKERLMTGDEAVARGAWEAGATVATAYPGTPATEINEHLAAFKESTPSGRSTRRWRWRWPSARRSPARGRSCR